MVLVQQPVDNKQESEMSVVPPLRGGNDDGDKYKVAKNMSALSVASPSAVSPDAKGFKFNPNESSNDEDGRVGATDAFMWIFGTVQILCLVLFAVGCDYDVVADDPATSAAEFVYYNNVAFMLLIGFGFLMTFLRNYALGSVGMTFLITVVMIQVVILLEGFWHGIYNNHMETIKIGVFSLVSGNFGAATVMISFGCMIGKIDLAQMCLIGVLELIFYTFNMGIILKWLGVVDIGGSIAIHMFGAFFGLAATYVWGHKPTELEEKMESSSRSSDVFSLIGTVFLWIFWPSFNGAPAANNSAQQLRVTVNTVLSLCACCCGTFLASRYFSNKKGKFSPADIQNATLAGGVAIGSVANMIVKPWGAIAIGLLGGILSTWGYRIGQPYLAEKFGLHDTCGVQNLHGWPSLLGGFVSIIVSALAKESDGYTEFSSVFPEGNKQAGAQALGIVFTLLVSIISGGLCAYVVKMALPKKEGIGFRDAPYWELEEGY